MTPKDLIDRYETIGVAASSLGYSWQTVRNWQIHKRIPPRAQIVIESITGGKLKADKNVR
jgi:hypothetical protein